MSKAVLMSIQPKWCARIADGRKTVEIRKSRPKLETPFKVYIYCTKGKEKLIDIMRDGDDCYGQVYHGNPVFIKIAPEIFFTKNYNYGNMKIIGEFIVDYIYTILAHGTFDEKSKTSKPYAIMNSSTLDKSCLTDEEIQKYLSDTRGYGWHISDLVIYDTPKELSDFGKTRPPQSWCYVEEEN